MDTNTLYVSTAAAAALALYLVRRRATKTPPTIAPSKTKTSGNGPLAQLSTGMKAATIAGFFLVLSIALAVGFIAVAVQIGFYSSTLHMPRAEFGNAFSVDLTWTTPTVLELASWAFTLMATLLICLGRDATYWLRWMWTVSGALALVNAVHNMQTIDWFTGVFIGLLSLLGPLLVHAAIAMLLHITDGPTVAQRRNNVRERWAKVARFAVAALRLVVAHAFHPWVALRALSYWAVNGQWTYRQAWHVAATGWRVNAHRTITNSVHGAGRRWFKRKGDQQGDQPAVTTPTTGDQTRVTTPAETKVATPEQQGDQPTGDQGDHPGEQPGDHPGGQGGDQGDHPTLFGLDHPADDPLLTDALATLNNQVATPADLATLFGGGQAVTSMFTPGQGGDHPAGGQGGHRGDQGDHPGGQEGDHPEVATPEQDGDQEGGHPGGQAEVTTPDREGDHSGGQGGDHPAGGQSDQGGHPADHGDRNRVTTPRQAKPNTGDQEGGHPGGHPARTVTASDEQVSPRDQAADYYWHLVARGDDPKNESQSEVARWLGINRTAVRRGFDAASKNGHRRPGDVDDTNHN